MSERRHPIPRLIALAAVIFGVFLILWPEPRFDSIMSRAAGLAVITIGLLATAVIPEYLTALTHFLAAAIFNIAPPDIIFFGFQSAAVWLVFGGLVIGAAITCTGLGKRIAERLAGHLNGGYTRIISGMTGFPIKAVLMMQVTGFSTVFLPYQAPPIIVALQMSGESTCSILKPLFYLAILTYGALVPLNYWWWRALGWLYGN